VHDSAAWLTVYAWPAIVSVAVRAAPVFAAAVSVTVPDPDPLAGLTVTQAESLAAVHPQLESLAVTATPPVPPVAATPHDVPAKV
jgi:hypothetical protein